MIDKPHVYSTVTADAAGSGHIWAWSCACKCDAADLHFADGLFTTPVATIGEAELLALVNGLVTADNIVYLPSGGGTWVELRSDSMTALRTLRTHLPRLTTFAAAPDGKIPFTGKRRKPLSALEQLGLGRIRDLCYKRNFALRLVYTHGHSTGSLAAAVDRRARAIYRSEAKAQGVTKHAQSFPAAHSDTNSGA